MRRLFAILIALALVGTALSVPMRASADVAVGVSVNIGPPPLPYYPQPFCPGPGFIWTPGYWAYGPVGYYWVPGTWILAPVGLLWTPGWWGWHDGLYWWHRGYWGPHVGFYGGINYGYGYGGHGYAGGYWRGSNFFYNRAVNRVDEGRIHNTYSADVPNDFHGQRVSYNGGPGGIVGGASAEEQAYAKEHQTGATSKQSKHESGAGNLEGQRFTRNQGQPDVAATSRPGRFTGNGAVRINAKRDGYEYNPGRRASGMGRQGSMGRGGGRRPPR